MYTALVVEDEPLMREYLLANLSAIHRDWQTTVCAKNGLEAMELLKKRHFDLVITDIKMPQMDGLELANYIHKNLPDTNVILLTGYDEFDYARAAVRAGVTDYLLKPLKDMELHNVLNDISQKLAKLSQKCSDTEQNGCSGSAGLTTENTLPDINAELHALSPITPGKIRENESSNIIIQRARIYIQTHYTSPLSLNELAEILSVNAAYLSSIFKSDQGESFSKYILRLRMERAALLLRTHPAAKINEIAEETGYVSARHFDAAFKKYYGITPNEYRLQNRT